METLEFAVELRKKEEKDKVMENSYARFQIREAVGRSQMFFKIGILKNFLRISQEKSWLQYLFNQKRLRHWPFPVKLTKFFRTPFSI